MTMSAWASFETVAKAYAADTAVASKGIAAAFLAGAKFGSLRVANQFLAANPTPSSKPAYRFACQTWGEDWASNEWTHLVAFAAAMNSQPAPPTPLMPIETAPKDGTWFLAYREAADCGSWDRFVVVRWHDEFSDFIWPDQPFDIFNDDIDETRENGLHVQSPYESTGTFTAWCPLPAHNPAPQPHLTGDGEATIIECLAAGKPFVFDAATNFLHADDGTVECGIRYAPAPESYTVKDKHGLRPCPFCGGKSELQESNPHDHVEGAMFAVFCLNCSTEQPWKTTAEEAAVAWNTRTLSTASDAATDRIEIPIVWTDEQILMAALEAAPGVDLKHIKRILAAALAILNPSPQPRVNGS